MAVARKVRATERTIMHVCTLLYRVEGACLPVIGAYFSALIEHSFTGSNNVCVSFFSIQFSSSACKRGLSLAISWINNGRRGVFPPARGFIFVAHRLQSMLLFKLVALHQIRPIHAPATAAFLLLERVPCGVRSFTTST